MSRELPRLEDYGLSPVTGFLPESVPLRRLPEYFEPWEAIAGDLPALLLTRRLRGLVDKMPALDANVLADEPEWRRACTVLGFISHAYVWSRPEPKNRLPAHLADPWLVVSQHFGLPPISSFAGLCLWNFRTVLPTENPEDWDLEMIATLTTFTGSSDESWFYLVSTAIERAGAPCLDYGIRALAKARENDAAAVVELLRQFAETVDKMIDLLGRMHEMCDPHVFYFRLRPYLAGWKSMADVGLPDGVWYGDEAEPRVYSGGSNAQSSLIQALDILLNVVHKPLGERKPPAPSRPAVQEPSSRETFLEQMRQYMPRQHREFLYALGEVADMRTFVMGHQENSELVVAYDACLAMLHKLRSRHIQLVTRFIVMPAREAQNKTIRDGLAKGDGATGTGGTNLLPFLKQARDEVGDAAAGSWGRRLLTNVYPKGEHTPW